MKKSPNFSIFCLFGTVLLSLFFCIFADARAGEFQNPVKVTYENGKPFLRSVPDPTVVRAEDGTLYCFATLRIVLKSTDGVTWKVHTENVIPNPTWGNEYYGRKVNAKVWAPDVRKVNGKWIYYYSLSAWGLPCGIGYAVADEIGGPYQDMGPMFTCKEIGIENCIDPQVIVEEDGRVFMVMGSFRGIYLVELTADGMACKGGKEFQKKNKILIAGYPGPWDGATYEGSYIVKKDGFYYFFGSVGTCCQGKASTYHVKTARAKRIEGPYCGSDGVPLTESGHGKTYGNLVVRTAPEQKEEIAGPGHNSVFIDEAGQWWFCCHAFTALDNFRTRRFFMEPLFWDEEGFPILKDRQLTYQTFQVGPRIEVKTESDSGSDSRE